MNKPISRAFLASVWIPILLLIGPGKTYSNIEFSGGETIYRVLDARSLYPGGFHFDLRTQFQELEVDTSNLELAFNMAYGLFHNLDFSFYLPYYRRVIGANNLHGQGDAIIGLKYSVLKPWKLPMILAIHCSVLLPTGYQHESENFPPYSINQIGFAPRLLLQLQSKKVTLLGNMGFFTDENRKHLEVMGGFGMKINLVGRILQAAGEYYTKHDYKAETASSSAYAGLESHLPYIGLGLKIGIDYPIEEESSFRLIAGLSITSRKFVPGVSRGIIESGKRYSNVMVFDFLDEDDYFVDEKVTNNFARKLGSLKEIAILDPGNRIDSDIASLNRGRALEETVQTEADLLVFGRYLTIHYERNRGLYIPFLLHLPYTVARVTAEIWVIDTKTERQVYTGKISGKASKLRGVLLFPKSGKDIHFLEPSLKEALRKKAVGKFIDNLTEVFSERIK